MNPQSSCCKPSIFYRGNASNIVILPLILLLILYLIHNLPILHLIVSYGTPVFLMSILSIDSIIIISTLIENSTGDRFTLYTF